MLIIRLIVFVLSCLVMLRCVQAVAAVALTGLAKEVTLKNAAIKFVIGLAVFLITSPYPLF